MEKIFARFANGWVIILSFVLMVLCIWRFGVVGSELGAPSLDGRDAYTFDEVMTAFAAYGEHGRALYARTSLTLDTLFPLVFGSFFIGLMMRYRLHRLMGWFAWLVVIGVAFDFAENIQVARLLSAYPDISVAAVERASFATEMKWLFLRVAQLIIVLQIVITLARWCVKELSEV